MLPYRHAKLAYMYLLCYEKKLFSLCSAKSQTVGVYFVGVCSIDTLVLALYHVGNQRLHLFVLSRLHFLSFVHLFSKLCCLKYNWV